MIEPKDLPPEFAGSAPVAPLAELKVAAPVIAAMPAVEVALAPAPAPIAQAAAPSAAAAGSWLSGLEQDARSLLQAGHAEVWDTLTHQFEAQLIRTALEITRGRRIEAAQKLGIGRNTITRKIQELGLDD